MRPLRAADVEQVEAIAEKRRQQYANFQPQFWRIAPDAVEKHAAFLRLLASDDGVVSLVSTDDETVTGYVIGRLVPPPPVYDPGGPSGYIDDFALADDADWEFLGVALLREATKLLSAMGPRRASLSAALAIPRRSARWKLLVSTSHRSGTSGRSATHSSLTASAGSRSGPP